MNKILFVCLSKFEGALAPEEIYRAACWRTANSSVEWPPLRIQVRIAKIIRNGTERQSCFIADYKMFVCARYNYLAYIYGPMSILFHALGLFEFCHNSFKKHLFPQDKNSFLTTVLIQKYAHDNAQNLLIIGR